MPESHYYCVPVAALKEHPFGVIGRPSLKHDEAFFEQLLGRFIL
ncbi:MULTISPECIES: hypothetical protein [Moorena]|nr:MULTISPECIES: hypothetical protein [Moorena]